LHERYPRCLFNGINSGIAGDTISQAIERIDRDVLRYAPDLTIIAFALNDAMSGRVGLPLYQTSLRRAVELIRPHSAVILLTPCMMASRATPLVSLQYQEMIQDFVAVQTSGILDTYVDAMRGIATDMDVPLADAYRLWRAQASAGVDTTLLLANGLNHPFGHAHRFFVDALLECLMPNMLD